MFIRQLVDAIFVTVSNAGLTAFLKNPLLAAGFPNHHAIRLAQNFEHAALRGQIHSPKIGKFHEFLTLRRNRLANEKHIAPRIRSFTDEDWKHLLAWSQKIDLFLAPLVELASSKGTISLGQIFHVLRSVLSELGRDEEERSTLSSASGAEDIETLFRQMQEGSAGEFTLLPEEFPAILDALFSSMISRSGANSHPRLHIYGPLEVRLLNHDRVILAGLNEDTWPQNFRSDPFLNRTLRRQLGMPSPERRTGLAAHDFQQLMASREVILSRSGRVNKAPTVASRWIQRLSALLGNELSKTLKMRGDVYLRLADMMDEAEERSPRQARPAPTPPVKNRPNELPVTDIETWIRDPYALYAKRVLKLSPLDPLEREPDALLKGTLYHKIMEVYVLDGGPDLPVDERYEFLNAIANRLIEEENLADEIAKLWKLRFGQIADAYLAWEVSYQETYGPHKILTEIKGSIDIVDDGFTLTARADRIDIMADNRSHLFDYKTGSSPSPAQARSLSPQLALEALIVQEGGYPNVEAQMVADMRYLRLKVKEKIGAENIEGKNDTLESIILKASMNLNAIVAAYRDPDQGYVSRHAPFKDGEMGGDYDHLARVREWSFGEDDDDE